MKNPFSRSVTWLLILVILLLNFLNPANNILSWDVFGYYLYLPLTFVYRDLSLDNMAVVYEIFEKYQPSSTLYQIFRSPEGGWVLKYSMGLAVLQSPFFFIGHLVATLSDAYPADGFSLPYQRAVAIGCMGYTVLALLVLRKLLLKFFPDRTTALVMLILVLGTNYFYSVSFVGQNSNPQNFGFTLYVLILWYSLRWHEHQKIRDAAMLGLFCGLNILSRPTEIVCLVLPVFWGITDRGSFSARLKLFGANRRQVLIFVLILLAIGFLQFSYWKAASGHFLYYSYGNRGGEGLDLWKPHLFKVLFSFRKGWLVYTPVMVVSLIGFRSMYRRNRALFYPFLAYFLANLYLVSSWSTWWYADCYGQRALVPSYVVLAFPLGYFLRDLSEGSRPWKWPFLTLAFLLVALNLFQTWQYTRGIIDSSRMTRQYYFRVFGKTKVTREDKKLLLVSRQEWPVEHVPGDRHYRESLLWYDSLVDSTAGRGDRAQYFQMNPDNRFTPAFRAAFRELTTQDHFYARASVEVFMPEGQEGETPLMVMAFEHKGKLYKYCARGLEPGGIKPNAWNRLCMDYLSPEVRSRRDKLTVYLWYRGEGRIPVRNLRVDLFVPED